ncbi:MAG: hypothetical protein M3R38_34270 [Actinomycetota bacterium]|nr:hypothetical protein [Actinomycetota bacterium]
MDHLDGDGSLAHRRMRERAGRLGGTLQVESRLGGGIRVRALIPAR